MTQVTHRHSTQSTRPRLLLGRDPIEFHTRGDKRAVEWHDARRPDVSYQSRFDLTSSSSLSLGHIRKAASDLLSVTRYVPTTTKATSRYIDVGTANDPRKKPPGKNISDYLGGFLGFRCHRYRLGLNGVGGQNPLSLVIHGRRDFDILIEDCLRYAMVEFTVAHEIGHYVLHSCGGTKPMIWPRLSRGRHDAEATVFAGCIVLPDYRVDEILEGSGGSVLEASYAISELFMWWRMSPSSAMK